MYVGPVNCDASSTQVRVIILPDSLLSTCMCLLVGGFRNIFVHSDYVVAGMYSCQHGAPFQIKSTWRLPQQDSYTDRSVSFCLPLPIDQPPPTRNFEFEHLYVSQRVSRDASLFAGNRRFAVACAFVDISSPPVAAAIWLNQRQKKWKEMTLITKHLFVMHEDPPCLFEVISEEQLKVLKKWRTQWYDFDSDCSVAIFVNMKEYNGLPGIVKVLVCNSNSVASVLCQFGILVRF